MTLHHIIKQLDEEFDSAFDWADKVKDAELERWKIMYGFQPKDIKTYIHKRDHKILEGVREMIMSKNRDYAKDEKFIFSHVKDVNHAWENGYNNALDELILIINESLNEK